MKMYIELTKKERRKLRKEFDSLPLIKDLNKILLIIFIVIFTFEVISYLVAFPILSYIKISKKFIMAFTDILIYLSIFLIIIGIISLIFTQFEYRKWLKEKKKINY